MNTKLPLLALVLGFSGVLSAQNADVKKVPLAKTATPYEWLMRPTSAFFAETGLSAADSVSADTYRVGLDTNESVLVNVGHLDAINQDVVWYVAYENFKVKDLKVKVDSLGRNHNIINDGEGNYSFWLADAIVNISTNVQPNGKIGTVALDAIPVYRFMPPVADAVSKLDSTWQQLMTNVQYRPRTVERDSSKVSVTLKNITPLVSYTVFYPQTEGARPYVSVELNEGGGQGVLKWACKNYYDRFYDSFEQGSVWVSDSDQPIVKVGVLFDDGKLLNLTMTQSEFQGFADSDEE